ncbi:MAG: VIT domain-containing protein [Armatimonadia bacterium]
MYRCLVPVSVVLAVLLCGLVSACVVIPHPPPRPEIKPLYLQCKSQHVETQINDQVARTTVTTVLHNPHKQQVEGTFLYPLPVGASVSDFSYWMNGKEMKGELLDRDKARKIYEDIVRTMRDPALLEYEGGGLFKASIFPVPPDGDVQTKLQFTQVLKAEAGVVRYTHAVKLGRSEPNVGKLVVDISIKSQVPIKSVYSPSHKIEVVRKGDNNVSAGLELDDTNFNSDFELFYTMAEKDFGLNVLTHREEGEPGYFMMLLSPKQEWGNQEIEGKDVIFAVDTSGSMTGEKVEQAKKAFEFCLGALRPKDRFGLISFATETRAFEEKLLEASPGNVKRAKEFVAKIDAAGSTALNDALVQSLELAGKPGERPKMVIFLTDGLPTAGERDLEAILKNVAKANHTEAKDETGERVARMFVFGVGDDVNTHLLDRVADGNGGSSNYVRPGEDIEAAVSSLYSKMSHPVLSNLRVKVASAQTHDIYPQKLPDLFVGSQLVLVGRYDGSGGSAITLTGTGAGQERTFTYEASFPAENLGNPFLARVWAGRRIGHLLDELRLRGDDKEIREEVVRLALKFGIVTPYTSYLVQEDKVVAASRPMQQEAFNRAVPAGAPAPGMAADAMRAQVGAGAVHAAQSIQIMKENAQSDGRYQTYQSVGQRTFFQNGEVWQDTAWQEKGQILKVKAFSQAYFDLLKARPDLGQYLALGSRVQVQVGRVGVEIGPEGLETLTPAQLEELKK